MNGQVVAAGGRRFGHARQVVGVLPQHNADPLIKVHSGVLVGKTAITLARLYGSHAGASLKGTLTSTFRIPFPLFSIRLLLCISIIPPSSERA